MLLQWRVEGENNTETAFGGVCEDIFGRRDGEWRTRARDMGSGEPERGIWEVGN